MVKTVFSATSGQSFNNQGVRSLRAGLGLRTYGSPHGVLNMEVSLSEDKWLLTDAFGGITLNTEKLEDFISSGVSLVVSGGNLDLGSLSSSFTEQVASVSDSLVSSMNVLGNAIRVSMGNLSDVLTTRLSEHDSLPIAHQSLFAKKLTALDQMPDPSQYVGKPPVYYYGETTEQYTTGHVYAVVETAIDLVWQDITPEQAGVIGENQPFSTTVGGYTFIYDSEGFRITGSGAAVSIKDGEFTASGKEGARVALGIDGGILIGTTGHNIYLEADGGGDVCLNGMNIIANDQAVATQDWVGAWVKAWVKAQSYINSSTARDIADESISSGGFINADSARTITEEIISSAIPGVVEVVDWESTSAYIPVLSGGTCYTFLRPVSTVQIDYIPENTDGANVRWRFGGGSNLNYPLGTPELGTLPDMKDGSAYRLRADMGELSVSTVKRPLSSGVAGIWIYSSASLQYSGWYLESGELNAANVSGTVFQGGMAASTLISGGTMTIEEGGKIFAASVYAGRLYGRKGSIISAGVLSGGTCYIMDRANGADRQPVIINNFDVLEGQFILRGSNASGANIRISGGAHYLQNNARLTGLTIYGGTLTMALNTAAAPMDGYSIYLDDSNVEGGTVNASRYSILSNINISSGSLQVNSGAMASGVTVLSGGTLTVSSGGSAFGVTSNAGATVVSNAGAVIKYV